MGVRRRLAAAVTGGVLLAGCTASGPGRSLGAIGYVADKKPALAPATWVHTGDRIAELAAGVTDLDAGLGRRIAALDPAADLVVTLYYDGCAKGSPALVLDGSTLGVRYGETITRSCYRPVDTLAVFAVHRSSVPDPVRLEVCGRTITVTRTEVSGTPIGLC